MTDPELLEAAAGATGKKWRWFGANFCTEHDPEMGTYRPWSPLTDDGEALRLAAHLCMTVRHEDPNAVIAGWDNTQRVPFTHDKLGPWCWKEWLSDHGNDRTATTRRAIVRAAAAMEGKQ